MTSHLRANLWLLVLTVVICSMLYPAVLWGIGQTMFRHQAQGSLIDRDGRPVDSAERAVGSRLIAQPFKGDEYFHPRPSAVSYNAAASGASNWGPSNPALRKRAADDLRQLRAGNPQAAVSAVPADMVMASGSGLDPHITLKSALYQLERVAAAWAQRTGRAPDAVRGQIEELLRHRAEAPLAGLAGVPLVNVLEVNLALRQLYGSPPAGER